MSDQDGDDPAAGSPVTSYVNDVNGVNGSTEINSTNPSQWSTGLYDCFDDYASCCLTVWCSCITFGRIAEIVDQGQTSCCKSVAIYYFFNLLTWGNVWKYTNKYRSRLRERYKLPPSPCPDLPVHFFCLPCALCQEYRELQHRGIDMSAGWKGNMAKQNGAVKIPHVAPAGMSK